MNKLDIIYFLWGALFGLMAPLMGLFVGAQILPLLGTLLMFPIVLISKVVDQPFGEFSTGLMVLSITLSILVWGGVFVGMRRILLLIF